MMTGAISIDSATVADDVVAIERGQLSYLAKIDGQLTRAFYSPEAAFCYPGGEGPSSHGLPTAHGDRARCAATWAVTVTPFA